MQSAYDAYLTHHRNPPLVQPEEFAFFERVKKWIDHRTTYTEFLKLLNLFTQGIISMPTLLERSLAFIGTNDDLFAQFKELVGWSVLRDGHIDGEDWIIENEPVLDRPLVDFNSMKRFGASYRKLPDSEIDLACSGREPLDWAVLNDEWVAYATWASEGSGSHRKNLYEDAMYNSEQDRHWYSFQLESLARTINVFEPYAARLEHMSPDERAAFKLDPEVFAQPSPSIVERILKKVWGRDQGYEILDALIDNPAVTIPIVLARLKQKDEEWQRALREWNKIWRELDLKNYYRGLDHQAAAFKNAEKKWALTVKAFTTEIAELRETRRQKRFDAGTETPPRPLHQFEFGMPDHDVFYDALKLVLSYLDRDAGGYSAPERRRVERFLRIFFPRVFLIPEAEMEAQLGSQQQATESDSDDSDSDSAANGDDEDEPDEEAADDDDDKSETSMSPRKKKRAASPRGSSEDAHAPELALGEQTWINLAGVRLEEHTTTPRRYNLFGNVTFYCLLRCFLTLYHRLLTFKRQMWALAENPERYQRLNPLAVELGLAAPVPVIDEGENPAVHFYEHALELAEKFFDQEIDGGAFEEYLRYMGGINVYPLFTIDKLIQTLIKHVRVRSSSALFCAHTRECAQVRTAHSDAKCHAVMSLLEKDRMRESTPPSQQIAYRMETEAAIGNEDVYRLEWLPEQQTMTIQLLRREDLTMDDAVGSPDKTFQSYLASYALTSATEGIGSEVKAPLLKRNRAKADLSEAMIEVTPALDARVAPESYRLRFAAHAEDLVRRARASPSQLEGAQEARKSRMEAWLSTRLAAAAEAEAAEQELASGPAEAPPEAPVALEAAVAALEHQMEVDGA